MSVPTASAVISVALEPALSALVPHTSGSGNVGGSLETDDVDVLNASETRGLLGVCSRVSFETETGKDRGTLSDLPGEVVFLALTEHRKHEVLDTLQQGVRRNELFVVESGELVGRGQFQVEHHANHTHEQTQKGREQGDGALNHWLLLGIAFRFRLRNNER